MSLFERKGAKAQRGLVHKDTEDTEVLVFSFEFFGER